MRGFAFVIVCASCAASSAPSLTATPAPTVLLATATATATPTPTATATPTPPPPDPPPPPKRYRRVLSVGDSFNGAFSLALEKKFRADDAAFFRDTWVAVAIPTFARDSRLPDLLAKHDPDLVLVNLGANHIDDGDPETAAKHVHAIVQLIGARDCYWIAPALWKKDTGIVDVIARSVAPCRFFDSKGFKVGRRGDGWHPSVEGGAVWADRFWDFFQSARAGAAIDR